MTAAAKYYHQGGLEWYGIKTNKLWHAEASPLYCTTIRRGLERYGIKTNKLWFGRSSKATSPENDRFKAIRTATMGDEEIADEGGPRSAYELQALAIHAKDHAC